MASNHRAAAIAKAVAAIAIVGAVAASCASGDAAMDSSPAPASAAADDTPTGEAAAVASPEDQAEIIAITKTYVTGINNGDAKMLEYSMCQAMLDMYDDLSIGARPSPNPQQVNAITGIAVNGDVGIGTVEYTLVNDPSAAGQAAPLAYKYEAGWKICAED